ncbi:N-acetylglucosamine-6-phosphate deacetylase [Ammoniphilus oxalaticus]|uniref:N-acetylglucosamine-6-phosphate deacetylase n=1 Tax=Ammoniphilus oxalaticus TaxID=66863 RepID=A0A419SLL8_9BACL|nr:N-acetylglucosamine-6-phosphate deacetylase [Ammoniphilus oxalaticus]RKD24967.1 N-acetylglucosamine-6-phosphate deacetylase [Ammoniphilus oxalaticus]
MSNSWTVKGLTIYSETSIINNGTIRIRDGKIEEVSHSDQQSTTEMNGNQTLIFPAGYHLVPGFIDIHIHGTAGADTMDGTKQALTAIASALPKEGTTSFLATTMTQQSALIEVALQNVSSYMAQALPIDKGNQAAELLGVHLEGPFINEKRAGAQPIEHILEPNLALFQKWQRLANNQIKLVTLAPEKEEGLAFVRHLTQTGVVVSIGHSDATYEQTVMAIEAGLSQATHLYNGMRGLHHREPGVVGAAMLHPELISELIVDGIHSDPRMVQLAYRNKGKEGLILITDAMEAKGLRSGRYQLGGQAVFVDQQKGEARLQDGALAGSILKMDDAIRNMIAFTGCSLADVITMVAENPAKQLGVFDRKGSICAGKEADLVVLDENYELVMTFCRGHIAYEAEK